MAYNKLTVDGVTKFDLTADTATAADVVAGKTFHLASGVMATGTADYYTKAETNALLDTKTPVVGKGVNLLDNWYFVGGGSQQGGGQFPINQRGGTITIDGQTVNGYESTKGNLYSIDRWLLFGAETWKLARLEIKNDCIKVSLNSNRGIGIILPFLPAGKYKLSIIVKGCSSGMRFGLANAATYNTSFIGNSIVTEYSEVPKTFECSVTLESDVTNKIVALKSTGSDNCYAEIVAIKLELGDTQTLARQENGVWVLNDPPPNYALELAKCQRYQYVVDFADGMRRDWHAIKSNCLRTSITFPCTMRVTPTCDITNFRIFFVRSKDNPDVFAASGNVNTGITAYTAGPIGATLTNSNTQVNSVDIGQYAYMSWGNGSNGKLLFDANL